MVAGRLHNRHQPQPGHTQIISCVRVAIIQVIKLFNQAIDVTDAVTITVVETAHENLVKDSIIPPGHFSCSLVKRVSFDGWC